MVFIAVFKYFTSDRQLYFVSKVLKLLFMSLGRDLIPRLPVLKLFKNILKHFLHVDNFFQTNVLDKVFQYLENVVALSFSLSLSLPLS